jgi:hypothetical protein
MNQDLQMTARPYQIGFIKDVCGMPTLTCTPSGGGLFR